MASPADICPVCLQKFGDARVLPCLHNMCKACVDRMAVTATDGIISCSVCQTSVTLPPNGAAGLPKDMSVSSTHASDGCGSLECGMCDDDKTRKKPTMWCKQCRLPLCAQHMAVHVVSATSRGEAHLIGPLSMATQESAGQSSEESATQVCAHHGEPLKYHCGTCDVAICGACGLIGDHKQHHNVRLIKDILNDRKTEVNAKVDTLENDVVPRLEHSIQAVDNVSTELARRADEVRTDIRKAGKQAVHMVEAHVEQMVQEVDDLELSRCKVLDRQRDELKSHLGAARNAIQFRNRLMQMRESREETNFSLLHALGTRTEALITTHIKEEPQHHSNLKFKAASDGNLASKTKEGIGKLIPCQASARHCEIEGSAAEKVAEGKTMTITIRAKDRNGEKVRTGDDVITTRWTTASATECMPTVSIKNARNGTHTISCVCPSAGTFQLEVYVNGEKMATDVTITCVAFLLAFDPSESHPSITISEDGQKAVFQGTPANYLSVLGSSPMRTGQHTWKMKIGSNARYYMLGIAPKPLSPRREQDHGTAAFCWFTSQGGSQYYRDGVQGTHRLPGAFAETNDTIQLDLDCDLHTLQISNLRTGKTAAFSNLPDKEYFQFASLLYSNSSVEFVE